MDINDLFSMPLLIFLGIVVLLVLILLSKMFVNVGGREIAI